MLLYRYLLREITIAFAFVALLVSVIFTVYSLTLFLADAANGLLKINEVLKLTLYKSIIALEVLLPIAFYFGIIISFGRLQIHNEYTAMAACGFPSSRLNSTYIVFGLAIALLIGAISLVLRPWAYTNMYHLKDIAESSYELDRIQAKRFYSYKDDNRTVYIRETTDDKSKLVGIFIRKQAQDSTEIITAPTGHMEMFASTDSHHLKLEEARIFRSNANGHFFVGHFDHLVMRLQAQGRPLEKHRPKSTGNNTLWHSYDSYDKAEWEWRLSTPLSTMILTFMALAIIKNTNPKSRFSHLPTALAIYAIYYNISGVARTWVEQAVFPTSFWVHFVFGTLLLLVFTKSRPRKN